MGRTVEIEGDTLDTCRARAAQSLKLPVERVDLTVVQRGEKGLLWSKPWKIRAWDKADGGQHGGVRQSTLDRRLGMIDKELQSLNLGDDQKAQENFDKMLSSFETLSPERREEIQSLAGILDGNEGETVRERIAKDGAFAVRVAEDKRSAVIDIIPPEGMGKPVELKDVLELLRERGIVQGVDPVSIRQHLDAVLDANKAQSDIQIAAGRDPVDGEDGGVEYFVETTSKENILREDDSIDFHGKAKIAMVKAGDKLARLVPPGQGTPGVDVYGKAIPANPGNRQHLEAGPNVAFRRDTLSFVSEIDGIVELHGAELSVRPIFIVRGDVGMESGNVEFDGAVVVTGSVQSGFYIRSGGDITIHGTVEAAEIVSKNGSVDVKKGIAGKNRCFVSARGDVKTKYIESATVYARGSVVVESVIMHSNITAGKAVVVLAGRGPIMGGAIRAGQFVQAKRLGAENEPFTSVTVGINIDEHEHLADIDRQVVSLQNVCVHIEEAVKAIEFTNRGRKPFPRSDLEKLKALRMKMLLIHNEIDALDQERTEFLDKIVADARGSIHVASEAFGKVEVRIGPLVESLRARTGPVTFRIHEGEQRIAQDGFRDMSGSFKD